MKATLSLNFECETEMAEPIKLKIAKYSDKDVVNKFCKFASENGIAKFTVAFPHKQINISEKDEKFDLSDEFLDGILGFNGNYILNLTIVFLRLQIAFTRQESYDEITITPLTNPVSEDSVVLNSLGSMKNLFDELDSGKIITEFFSEDVKKFYEHREVALQRLEHISQKLIEDNEAYRLKIDEEKSIFKAKTASLYEEKEQALISEKARLDKREEEMELADAKSSRRKLRRDLLEQMKPSKIIADDTGKRWPIHALFIFVSGLLSFFIFSLFASSEFDLLKPTESIKLGIFSIGLVGTLTVYYRWMDAWQRLKVDESLRLRQLSIDVDRANWIVEMLSEYKNDNEIIPPEVVSALTKNMFSTRKGTDGVTHPAEDMLAALLGSSKEIEVDLPNGRLVTNGKSIKKASENAG